MRKEKRIVVGDFFKQMGYYVEFTDGGVTQIFIRIGDRVINGCFYNVSAKFRDFTGGTFLGHKDGFKWTYGKESFEDFWKNIENVW